MSRVRIFGHLKHSDGADWSGATIDISYHGYSQTPTEQRPSDRTPVKTNPDGTWETYRWVNAEGDYQSYYSFKFPFDQPIKVFLPAGLPPEIEFSQLAIASTPPSDPSYPSLIALINELFASGDFVGTADVISLKPPIPGLGGTVQTAIAALFSRNYLHDQRVAANTWIVNHNLGFKPNREVILDSGESVTPAVWHVSINQFIVYWSAPKTGFVRCS